MNGLPFDDRADFQDADRGLIGSLDPGIVQDASGRVVWDNDAWAFLGGDCPETANPSLWRQSQLCARQGLFEVTAGIYQVRGLDLSNMTIVEGDRGVIVIDPLISTETAAACMAENATHNLHNLLTLRGALVRDPRIWARYLNEAITAFGDRADVAFASHHGLGGIQTAGDLGALQRVLGLLDTPDPGFAIVTP